MKTTTLGERLKEVMRELKIESPKDLATFCDVSEGLVSQWFSGTTKLGAKPLISLSRTHFSLDWIVDGKQPKYRSDYDHAKETNIYLAANQDDETPAPEDYAQLILLFGKASKAVRKEALRSLDKSVKARDARKRSIGSD